MRAPGRNQILVHAVGEQNLRIRAPGWLLIMHSSPSAETACWISIPPPSWPLISVLTVSEGRGETGAVTSREVLSGLNVDLLRVSPRAKNPFLGVVSCSQKEPQFFLLDNPEELTRMLCPPKSFLVPVHSLRPGNSPSSNHTEAQRGLRRVGE